MKYHLLFALFFAAYFGNATAQDNLYPKLSPHTQEYLLDIKDAAGTVAPLPNYVYKNTASGIYMSAIAKVSVAVSLADMNRLGIHVGTKAGNIWTIQVPIANVEAATRIRGIEYFELDMPIGMKLDSVRKAMHVDSIHQGINLPMPYAGKDVIVGVVDVGFDFTHPTFRDTSGHSYRIKRAWLEKTAGTPPAGFIYGSELTDSASIFDAHTDNIYNSHGTHVAGIAAGSGHGSGTTDNKKYRGIAYETDMVMVGIMPDSLQWQNTGISDIVDGINYVFKYATAAGKPAVVNLSWGSVVGPRDGSSLFSQAVDAMTGAGKIFVVAAGNEGENAIHLQKKFTSTDTIVNTFVNDDPYLADKSTWLDIWGQAGKTFCVKASLYNDSITTTHAVDSTGFICLDNSTHRIYLKGSHGDTCIVTFTTSASDFNGKPRVYVGLVNKSKDTVCISMKSTDGTINLWNGYIRDGHGYNGLLVSGGRPWAVGGDTAMTTSDLVATQSAVSVGAYSAKINFRNISNQLQSYSSYTSKGMLVPFSSHGPTADDRVKPDITAPGLCVVSAVSSFDSTLLPGGSDYGNVISKSVDSITGRTHYYAQFSGTSMATPAISGVVALMLQVNPNLNPNDVHYIIQQTAISDTFTGPLPAGGSNTWGHGKINAYQALIMASTFRTGINSVANILDCKIFPNPSNGNFTIDYVGTKEENVTIEVLSLEGKSMLFENWKTVTGKNNKSVDLTQMVNGIYFVKVTSTSGSSTLPVMVAK